LDCYVHCTIRRNPPKTYPLPPKGPEYIKRIIKWAIDYCRKADNFQGISFFNEVNITEENRKVWSNYDWSQFGEEWSLDAKRYRGLDPNRWKTLLVNKMMLKYIKKGSTVLEIGPGAGRWTEVLIPICSRLLIADILEKCLLICKERFKAYSNIEYYHIEGGRLDFIPDDTVDYIWSYDVFVHINPTDTERYIIDFKRILKPGGFAIIHHSDTYLSEVDAKNSFRSYMDGKFFTHLVEKHGMRLVEQNTSVPHKPGDLISVFMRPLQ